MFFSSVKKINRLRNQINRLLRKEVWMFLMDILNSIKEKNRLRKEINRSLSKGISNIYLKLTIEEKN